MQMLAECSRLSHMDVASPSEQLAAESLAGLSGQRQP